MAEMLSVAGDTAVAFPSRLTHLQAMLNMCSSVCNLLFALLLVHWVFCGTYLLHRAVNPAWFCLSQWNSVKSMLNWNNQDSSESVPLRCLVRVTMRLNTAEDDWLDLCTMLGSGRRFHVWPPCMKNHCVYYHLQWAFHIDIGVDARPRLIGRTSQHCLQWERCVHLYLTWAPHYVPLHAWKRRREGRGIELVAICNPKISQNPTHCLVL